jgi:ketosteroid isomerase-like protein
LIDQCIAAYNNFDIEGMLAVLSPDFQFENYSGGHLTVSTSNKDEFRQLAEKSASLFSEREQRVTSLQCTENSATADIAYRSRLAADIPGGPVAGTVLICRIRPSSALAITGSRKLSTAVEITPDCHDADRRLPIFHPSAFFAEKTPLFSIRSQERMNTMRGMWRQ